MARTYLQALIRIAMMRGHDSVSLGAALVASLALHAFFLHSDGATTSSGPRDQIPVALNATITRDFGDSGKLVSAAMPSDKTNGTVSIRSRIGRNNAIGVSHDDVKSGGAARIYEVGELDVRPALLTWTMPEYPQHVPAYVAAVVVVEFVVNESGAVSNISILEASGPPDFDQAVRLAFLQAKYTPGYLGARPVAARIRIKVDFNEPV